MVDTYGMNDGERDEIAAGVQLLDPEGELIWKMEDDDYVDMTGFNHAACTLMDAQDGDLFSLDRRSGGS